MNNPAFWHDPDAAERFVKEHSMPLAIVSGDGDGDDGGEVVVTVGNSGDLPDHLTKRIVIDGVTHWIPRTIDCFRCGLPSSLLPPLPDDCMYRTKCPSGHEHTVAPDVLAYQMEREDEAMELSETTDPGETF